MVNGMLLVNSVALPDVFQKVVEAKKLIATGIAKTASEGSLVNCAKQAKRCASSSASIPKTKSSTRRSSARSVVMSPSLLWMAVMA